MDTNIYWLWLLIMGSLIFLMQAGFFLLEGGQVRSRDVTNVMMKMTGQVTGPPFGARRRREPGRLGELSGQLADHRDPVAVGGQDARAGYPAHLSLDRLVLLRFTVPLPAGQPGNRFAKPPGETACQSCGSPATVRPKKNQVTIPRMSG